MNSQVVVEYTDAKKRTDRRTDNVDQEAIVSYQPIPNGVKITFTMEALGFIIPIEYTLGDNYLEVRVRDEDLKETSEYIIVNMWLVPFFGSVPDTEEGYMVIPDGSVRSRTSVRTTPNTTPTLMNGCMARHVPPRPVHDWTGRVLARNGS